MEFAWFRSLFAFLTFMTAFVSASCQTPINQWSFEGNTPLKDHVKGANIIVRGTDDNFATKRLSDSDALKLNGREASVGMSVNQVQDAFSISFFFKGGSFQFLTLPKQNLMVRFNYPMLFFRTTVVKDGKETVDNWQIELNGTGINSYDYYADGNWHHISFTVDLKSGQKKVFVDGLHPNEFSKSIAKGGKLLLSGSTAFRGTMAIDELQIFNVALSENAVKRSIDQVSSFKRASAREISNENFGRSVTDKGHNVNDFAPGYPRFDISAIQQLQNFPDPRLPSTEKSRRNFPWMDILYLHRDYEGAKNRVTGISSGQKAIDMAMELYNRWNYYFEIPVPRSDRERLEKTLNSNSSIHGALIDHARKMPSLQTAAVLFQTQINPSHAGFDQTRPYVMSQNLPANYYLQNSKGDPIVNSRKKWLSPLAPLDIVYKDAATAAFYLDIVATKLGRPIDFLNENGEFFGHLRKRELLELDPRVKADIAAKKMNIPEYNGWFQNRLDTAYKNEIIRKLNWSKTYFTFYNIAAIQPNYWPEYSMRRTSNLRLNGIHYSTPNFYPARPDNWRQNRGTLNGYGIIADGRKREIELGDKLFAPFVSAGWAAEENNIRPAQWLALLKSMVMLGADFFHVGFFNITGSKGWPNGIGPYDPRGYIYQAAMPTYAQAIGTRAFEFLTDGELLNPYAAENDLIYNYRFKTGKENQLIIVRKKDSEYLIYGSLQPNSNLAGNTADQELATIQLENKSIVFPIRRQGSIYFYKAGSRPVFYSLDGWHESSHPYYWSKNYRVEAELAENLKLGAPSIQSENIQGTDFSNVLSFVQLNTKQSLVFSVPKENTGSLSLRARGSGKIRLNLGGRIYTQSINNKDWALLNPQNLTARNEKEELIIEVLEGSVDIDFIEINAAP